MRNAYWELLMIHSDTGKIDVYWQHLTCETAGSNKFDETNIAAVFKILAELLLTKTVAWTIEKKKLYTASPSQSTLPSSL